MVTQKLSEKYLFEKHSKNVIKRWNKSLRYGFFKRANGGHANDGDEFRIWLKYDNRDELFEILSSFNIKLKRIPDGHPRIIPGKAYSWKKFSEFKSEIKDFPEFEQPLHVKINKAPCYCWIENGKIHLSFSGAANGNPYEVSETDFENCLRVERIILDKDLAHFLDHDYDQWSLHISRKLYPELYE